MDARSAVAARNVRRLFLNSFCACILRKTPHLSGVQIRVCHVWNIYHDVRVHPCNGIATIWARVYWAEGVIKAVTAFAPWLPRLRYGR